MKRQVILIMILCAMSIVARGQNKTETDDVQSDTLKQTEQRQKIQRVPVNDYSGLNSLRARLANRSWDGQSDTTMIRKDADGLVGMTNGQLEMADVTAAAADDIPVEILEESEEESGNKSIEYCTTGNRYFDDVISSGMPIGAPLLVFFKAGGTELTDSAQLINVKAVAELARSYGLKIRVTGSADSATGTVEKNEEVAQYRARFVTDYLVTQGVSEESIITVSVGGVETYSPVSANRNCRIELLL